MSALVKQSCTTSSCISLVMRGRSWRKTLAAASFSTHRSLLRADKEAAEATAPSRDINRRNVADGGAGDVTSNKPGILSVADVVSSIESNMYQAESLDTRGPTTMEDKFDNNNLSRNATYVSTPSFTSKRIIVRSRLNKTQPIHNSDRRTFPLKKNNTQQITSKNMLNAAEVNSIIDNIITEDISSNETVRKTSCDSNSLELNTNKSTKHRVDIESNSENRTNQIGIQMISQNLYDQVFNYSSKTNSSDEGNSGHSTTQSIEHLKQQKLWGKPNTVQENVNLILPKLFGDSVSEHFRQIAEDQCSVYKELLHDLTYSPLPPVPSEFVYREGWTKYYSDGSHCNVTVPDCDAYVFDVEVCVRNGSHPTLASAVSDKHWYTWCSKTLINNENNTDSNEVSSLLNKTTNLSDDNLEDSNNSNLERNSELFLDDLVPFGGAAPNKDCVKQSPKIIVGHNVGYDRVRIKEQYYIPHSAMRFLDTMSLHIAVSGLVQEQRAMIMKNSSAEKKVNLPWMSVGSLNNLNDVYKFYCKAAGLKKETRDVFVKGSMEDIRNDFQNLMAYCTKDVKATHEVLVNLLPQFYERFPNPVTMAGVLEMGSSYLPVNDNWDKYIDNSEETYATMQRALTEKLSARAVEALQLLENDQYENDPWLWNLDWEIPPKLKKTGKNLPSWYVKLCKSTGEREGSPEPDNMSTSLRVVPKLLRLTWKGLPLHHEKDYGWGYLRPSFSSYDNLISSYDDCEISTTFPVEELYKISPARPKSTQFQSLNNEAPETEEDWEKLLYGGERMKMLGSKPKSNTRKSDDPEDEPIDINIPGVEFIRLPHKNGPKNNVGNPLAKDFLHKIEDGTLSSQIQEVAELVLRTTKTIAYWRNARDRINSQSVVWLSEDNLPRATVEHEEYNSNRKYGAILPQVVVCGTVTRRAVERTWLTASNARTDRIGSELKAMVTAPPGYHFVGADVDSQELWIAALLGDAYFAGLHGCTAMSWMTLQGSKAEGTDLHSNTANTAQITRDQAKVINYGRIYGAGLRFLKTLLTQYNPNLSAAEAQSRAEILVKATKGEKGWYLSDDGKKIVQEYLDIMEHQALSRSQVTTLLRELSRNHRQHCNFAEFVSRPTIWVGGSESHTFNCLEAIVRQDAPASPVMEARIPRPLEPHYAGTNYMTSRMNWVVQSSAVDYLHLMTVCMRWLANKYNIDVRFSISIHDEVRYLVSSEDRHRAALALQITNLLTRALFAYRVDMPDLPLAVAFFSSVDIDKVLRKDPESACVTPSNPGGLQETYGVPYGQTLTIYDLIKMGVSLDDDLNK